jgi:hypothetical protein
MNEWCLLIDFIDVHMQIRVHLHGASGPTAMGSECANQDQARG